MLDSDAGVVILLADSNDGTQFLEALNDEPDRARSPTIIVNDAMRSPESSQRLAGLDSSIRQKIRGVAPQAEVGDPTTRSIRQGRSPRTRSTA